MSINDADLGGGSSHLQQIRERMDLIDFLILVCNTLKCVLYVRLCVYLGKLIYFFVSFYVIVYVCVRFVQVLYMLLHVILSNYNALRTEV